MIPSLTDNALLGIMGYLGLEAESRILSHRLSKQPTPQPIDSYARPSVVQVTPSTPTSAGSVSVPDWHAARDSANSTPVNVRTTAIPSRIPVPQGRASEDGRKIGVPYRTQRSGSSS